MKPPPPTTTSSSTAVNSAITAITHSLDLNAFGHLIHHCSQSPALFNVGRQLHARLVLHSIIPSNFLASKLLSLYSRSGHLAIARKLFDEIPQKNLFSYNAMLIAYSLHSHNPYHCHQLFASMPWSLKPDAFTLSSLLKSVSRISTHKEIHGFSLRNGFLDSDLFVANGLIAGYAKMGHFRYARLVFDLMPERDIVSWNSIISGYSQAGNYDDCFGLFLEMVKGLDGVMPNGVTVASMLHACSQMKDLAMGTRVHQFAVKSEIEMDTMVWNSVIGFYAKCARLEYARSLFDEMQYKDAVSYNVMITGYMAHGFVDKAMNLFNRMANSTVSSWNAIIAGLVQNNQHSDALNQVLVMQDLGFRPNSITLSSILPAISFYLDGQNVRLDLHRFRKRLVKAYGILKQRRR